MAPIHEIREPLPSNLPNYPLEKRLALIKAINPETAMSINPQVIDSLLCYEGNQLEVELERTCGDPDHIYDQLALVLENPLVTNGLIGHEPQEVRDQFTKVKTTFPQIFRQEFDPHNEASPLAIFQETQMALSQMAPAVFLRSLQVMQALYQNNPSLRERVNQSSQAPHNLVLNLLDSLKLTYTMGGSSAVEQVRIAQAISKKSPIAELPKIMSLKADLLLSQGTILSLDLLSQITDQQYWQSLSSTEREQLLTGLVANYYDKLAMDYPALNYAIHYGGGTDEGIWEREAALMSLLEFTNTYAHGCSLAGPETTRKALLPYFYRRDLVAVYATDYWLTEHRLAFSPTRLDESHSFDFYRHITIKGLKPEGRYELFGVQPEILAVRNLSTGEVEGVVSVMPLCFSLEQEAVEIELLPPEKALNYYGKANIDLQLAQRFFSHFLELTSPEGKLAQALRRSDQNCDIRFLRTAALFRIYEFLEAYPEREDDLFVFISHYSRAGATAFLLEELAQGNAETLLDFGLTMAKDYEDLSKAKDIFMYYDLIAHYAPDVAYSLSPFPQEQQQLVQLINNRANKQLLGVLNLYRQHKWGDLEKSVARDSFAVYWSLLNNEAGSETTDMVLPTRLVVSDRLLTDAVVFHRGDVRAIFDSIIEARQLEAIIQQQGASYATQVREISDAFYGSQLTLMEKAVTGDTEMEIKRNIKALTALFQDGGLATGATLVAIGCGDTNRVETPVVNAVEQFSQEAGLGKPFSRLIGVDALDYPRRPDKWEFYQQDYKRLTEYIEPASADCLLGVWSPICDEWLIPDHIQMFTEFSRVLRPGGYLMIDIPLCFGEHSYEEAIVDQGQADSGLPKGLIKIESFSDPAHPEVPSGKMFYIFDSEEIIKLLEEAGFKVVNFADNNWCQDSQKRQAFYQEVSIAGKNDETKLRQNIDDPRQSPAWQTRERTTAEGELIKPRNRLTVIAKKVGEPAETSSILNALLMAKRS